MATEEEMKKLAAATTEAAEAQEHFKNTSDFATRAMDFFNAAGVKSKDIFSGIAASVDQAKISFQSMNALTKEQSIQFNLLSTAVFGASNEFKSLNDLDFSGFENQLNRLSEVARGGLLKSVTQIMAVGGKGNIKVDGIADIFTKTQNVVTSLASGADTASRFSESILATASSAGMLSSVYAASGENLEKFNEYSRQQYEQLQGISGALGLTSSELLTYRNSLTKLPGVMEQFVDTSASATGSTNALSAAILFARGSGRSYKDVIGDITKSYADFNIKGQESLQFIGRIQELTDKFGSKGVVYSDVSDALFKMSSEYKNITDSGAAAARMTEGMSRVMNEYLGRLADVGVTGKHATEIVSGLTDGISNMGVAQKSFLSSQTGGPGGLMGAFQIEKMLREGNIDGVMEKVQQQLKSQLGDIVTLDQASQSQEAASKFQRQVMMLKQGPMGSFVKTDQDAYKFLEAMKNKEMSGSEASLSEKSYEKYQLAGKEFTDRKVNPVTIAANQVEAQKMESSFAMKDQLESLLGAGKGSTDPTKDLRRESKETIRGITADMESRANKSLLALQDDIKSGKQIEDRKGQAVYNKYDIGSRAFDVMAKDFKPQAQMLAESTVGLETSTSKTEQQEYIRQSLIEAAIKDKKSTMEEEVLRQKTSKDEKKESKTTSVETAPKEVIHSVRIHVDAVCPDCAHKHTSTTVHGLNPPASRRGL